MPRTTTEIKTSSRADAAALVREALRSLAPGDAEARLRWLLALSERNLAVLNEEEWSRLQIQMGFIVTRRDWARRDHFPPPLDAFPVSVKQQRGFKQLQARLRALFQALVKEGRHEIYLPRRGAGHWVISRRKNATGRLEAEAHFLGHVWLQLVLLTVRLLDQIGAQRLKACPYRAASSGPCGRLFLAVRRQAYCSLGHSRKASFDAWLTRQGGTRAKR